MSRMAHTCDTVKSSVSDLSLVSSFRHSFHNNCVSFLRSALSLNFVSSQSGS